MRHELQVGQHGASSAAAIPAGKSGDETPVATVAVSPFPSATFRGGSEKANRFMKKGSSFVPIVICSPVVGPPKLQCSKASHWFLGSLNSTVGEYLKQATDLIHAEDPTVSPDRIHVYKVQGHSAVASFTTPPSSSSSPLSPWGGSVAALQPSSSNADVKLTDMSQSLASAGITTHMAVQKKGLLVRIDPILPLGGDSSSSGGSSNNTSGSSTPAS